MTEPQLPPADRSATSAAGAVLLATLLAPVAASALFMAIGFALDGLFVALEDLMVHAAMVLVCSYVAAGWRDPRWAAAHACIIAWLGVVPAMLRLRANGSLRSRTALPAGAVLPLSTV